MCTSTPKIQDTPPPPPPAPPPKPIDFGGDALKAKSKKSNSARKSLSIPLAVGGADAGGSGINLPS
jgi:hypothetical protein